VIDFKQRSQWEHLAFAKQEDVIADWAAEDNLLIV